MANDILIVDDEKDICNLVRDVLQDNGYDVRMALNAKEVYSEIAKRKPNLILLDVWLERSSSDGLDLFSNIHTQLPDLPIILISGHGTLEMATTAIRNGAIDFIPKPFNTEILLHSVRRALKEARIYEEHKNLLENFGGLVSSYCGKSNAIIDLQKKIDAFAGKSKARVLIIGESGTGKALTAWMIHLLSRGRETPFITLQCGENLEGSIFAEALFGKELAGDKDEVRYAGALERAHGGSVLLRNIENLPLESQNILLHALQRNYFLRVGGSSKVETDARVLATSRVDLNDMVQKGLFNKELYHRINVYSIHTPSLAERIEDIGELASSILDQLCGHRNWPQSKLDKNAVKMLENVNWSGNIWQLRAILETSLFLSRGRGLIDHSLVEKAIANQQGFADDKEVFMDDWYRMPLKEARKEFEKKYLSNLLKRYKNNVSEVARQARFERAALHRKLSDLGVEIER